MKSELERHLEESIKLHKKLLLDKKLVANFIKAADAIFDSLAKGHKLLAAGNGGSAADAQHFTTEFVGKYKIMRKGYSAIALTADPSILTAWSNDNSFDTIFARQIEAHARPGDILIIFSTSGNSRNILQAIKAGKKVGIFTIAFLGYEGGKAKGMADIEIIIPSKNTPRIQEAHKLIFHSIAEEVERKLSKVPSKTKK